MFLNIVTNTLLLEKVKTIPYFQIDLGSSFRRKGKRGSPDKVEFGAPFVANYYKRSGRLLMKSGKIGSINVYTDYGINQKSIHIYNDGTLFDFDFNHNDYAVSGSMQKYIGALLKKIERDHKVALPSVGDIKESENSPKTVKKHVDPTKVMENPGSVSWDDLQEYLNNAKK